ncbi:MAG TPA: CDC27 family protein, partial [Ktedonobacterales bacterium]|nr:CDC27 family protein [Ktedonobacterales bacterium]
TLQPASVYLLRETAAALTSLRRYQEALEVANRILALNPQDGNAWRFKAFSLANMGRDNEAIPAFGQAQKFLPEGDAAWYETMRNQALCLRRNHRSAEALNVVDRTLASATLSQETRGNLLGIKGACLRDLNRTAEAFAAFDQGLALAPKDAGTLHENLLALIFAHRWSDAIAIGARLVALDSANAGDWALYSTALDEAGKWQQALSAIDKAIGLNLNDPTLHYNRAIVLLHLNHERDAVQALDRAIGLNPNYGQAWLVKSKVLAAVGRRKEAQEAERRAKSLGM